VNSFSGVRESEHRDEQGDMRVAHADATVAREQRYESILPRKKRVDNKLRVYDT
jgi:hypothetical protein